MMDWNAVGTIVSMLTIGLAILALILEIRQSRISLQTDALLRLSEKFDSDRSRALRRIAAYGLLCNESVTEHNYALDDVLELFSEIAFLERKKVVHDELVFNQFSWWIIRYWLCAKKHIEKVRQQDPLSWYTFEKLAKELHAKEKQAGYNDDNYTYNELQKFLLDEYKLIVVDQGTNRYLDDYFAGKKTPD